MNNVTISLPTSSQLSCLDYLESLTVGDETPQIEAAKSEATEQILEATNEIDENDENDAMPAKRAVVLGLLDVCKNAADVLDVATKNAPLFAEFKKNPENFKGMKKMIHELSAIGFSVERIYSLDIYKKDKKLAIMSIKDAISKTNKELGLTTTTLTPEQLAERKANRFWSKKSEVVVETSSDIALKIEQYETMLKELKVKHVELLNAEKQALEADKIAKRASALKALTDLGISLEIAEGILSSQGK